MLSGFQLRQEKYTLANTWGWWFEELSDQIQAKVAKFAKGGVIKTSIILEGLTHS